MRAVMMELKKLFRLKYAAVAAALLAVLCLGVPKGQAAAVKITHTEAYPERFTVYEDYSVDVLFNDFLLKTCGQTVTKEELGGLKALRDRLCEQVARAAAADEVLLRIGCVFDAERAEFYGTDPDRSISEEDQIYEWSCVNGQMRLDNTDHPIGFIKRFDSVIAQTEQYGSYAVLGGDMLWLLRKNTGIVTWFSVAALMLTIPYGVSEVRSHTEALTYTTKAGRKAFLQKLLAAGIAGAVIIVSGAALAFALFSGWDVGRYYGCDISSAMAELHGVPPDTYRGITFLGYYVSRVLAMALVGVCGNLLAGIVSLHSPNAVSAAGICLPVVALELFVRLRYIDDYTTSTHSAPVWELPAVSVVVALVSLTAVAVAQWRKRRCQF